MHPILRNILAVILGFIAGSLVNMGIISLSTSVIAPPPGADVLTLEGLKNSMHLLEPKNFLMPFLAHALGTLAGAFCTAKIAASQHLKLAMLIGVLFFIGGFANILLLPSPLYFTLIDLIIAYLPASYLGAKLAKI